MSGEGQTKPAAKCGAYLGTTAAGSVVTCWDPVPCARHGDEAQAESEALKTAAMRGEQTMTDAEIVAALPDVQQLAALRKERDEAREWVRRLLRETQTLTCVYCGHAYPPGTSASGAEALTAHIKVCPKHPLRGAESLLREVLTTSDPLLTIDLHARIESSLAEGMASIAPAKVHAPNCIGHDGPWCVALTRPAPATNATKADCTCYRDCGEDSASGDWHVHEGEPCPAHPEARVVS